MLAAQSLSWWEYLHQGNWQTLQSSAPGPGWRLNVSQHNTGLSPTRRVVKPEEGDSRRKLIGREPGSLHTSTFWLALPSSEWHTLPGHPPAPFPWSFPLNLNTALLDDFWKSTWIVPFLMISMSSSQVILLRRWRHTAGVSGCCAHDSPLRRQCTSFRTGCTSGLRRASLRGHIGWLLFWKQPLWELLLLVSNFPVTNFITVHFLLCACLVADIIWMPCLISVVNHLTIILCQFGLQFTYVVLL